jgi:magnesium-transporting ATPase (P-type)
MTVRVITSLTRAAARTGVGGNPWLLGGVLAMWLLQLAFVYAPSMNRLFTSAPIDAASWSGIAAAALVSFGVVEIENAHERRRLARAARGR